MSSTEFAGRHVVITGASGALGRAVLAEALARGATCHVPHVESSVDFGALDGERLLPSPGLDLRDEAAVRAYYAGLPSLWASIHCAGGFAMSPLAETSLDDLRAMMALNLESAFLCTREALKVLRKNADDGIEGRGRIVNVSAQTALDARRGSGMVAYASSKAALASLSVALGEEVAAEGIWVNAVAPSILDTPANRAAMPDADHDSWASTEAVARTLLFLASPSNGSTRGGVIPVYGRS